MMDSAPRDQAVMLLTVSFGRAEEKGVKSLSAREWATFASWLEDQEHAPEHLLGKDGPNILARWSARSPPAPGNPKITAERLESLLARGMALGVCLERWERAGLWVVTRSDSSYPDRLRKRLGRRAPAVLFGCGDASLLGTTGIAVVGSRNAGDDDLDFAGEFGRIVAAQGYSVVSGAARGVDEHAMLGSLEGEGTVMGVVGDNLLRAATSQKYRQHLAQRNLVLVSPFQPEASFRGWRAMERNKYIYCLADAAVVACSQANRGGTWNGAVEALRAGWVPVWLRNGDDASGNAALADRGGRWLPEPLDGLDTLFGTGAEVGRDPLRRPPEADVTSGRPPAPMTEERAPLYDEFLKRFGDLTANGGLSRKEIAGRLELTTSQVNAWIRRGLDKGQIIKRGRPVRYGPSPSPLFGSGP